ncbi:hypothetical protein C0991_008546 [Blastosporella zonata]|nr:hypothetical protein C0991_008546 [Blastosporella zonata]
MTVTGITALPNEVIEQVLLCMDPIDVARISQCCKLLRLVLYNPKDQLLWRELYLHLPLDDPRNCVSLQGARKHKIDWRGLLQRFIRARTVLYDPSLSRPGELSTTLQTLLELMTWVPPLTDFHDFDHISVNLAWVVATLRGTSFFEDIELSTEVGEEERELAARLHTCFGLTGQDISRAGRVRSRAFLYDLRNYREENLFGPLTRDGRVNWLHIRAIHHIVSMHFVDLQDEGDFQFAIFPMSIQTTQIVLPRELNLDEEEDWAGVTGSWENLSDNRRWMLNSTAGYNSLVPDAAGNLDTTIFEAPDFGEVFRTLNVTVTMASTIPDPSHPKRPIIHFTGVMVGSTSSMNGTVQMTADDQVQWRFAFRQDTPLFPEPPSSPGSPLMSEQPTPPKPKPGSLRDRIAAFEKPAGSAAPGPAPVPRPKPGGVSWKPKAPSPPSSPSAADVSSERKTGGMSASDAKESIKTGGSLKERMAALQNRGGFGGPPPVAPKPPVEKPKWKPPPVIAPVDKDDDDEPSRDDDLPKPPPPLRKSTSDDKSAGESDIREPGPAAEEADAETGEAAEADPEEEERQRRAAIAARMARLGGARVGMAPVFGRTQSAKKTEPAKTETIVNENAEEDESQGKAVPSPSNDETTTTSSPASTEQPSVTSDAVELPPAPVRKDSVSSLSTETEAQPTRSPPEPMPLPSAPRRAGPPRRKTPKAPEVTTPAVVDEPIVISPENLPVTEPAVVSRDSVDKEHVSDLEKEVSEVSESVEELERPVAADSLEGMTPVIARDFTEEAPKEPSDDPITAHTDPKEQADATETNAAAPAHSPEPSAADDEKAVEINEAREPVSSLVHVEEEPTVDIEEEHKHDDNDVHVEKEQPETQAEEQMVEHEPEHSPVELTTDEPEEDEEAARRQRIAEKLAKMGGVNPFVLPPQRKGSDSLEDIRSSPPLTNRSSVGSPPLPPLPQRRQSTRNSIVESSPPSIREITGESTTLEDTGVKSEDDSREVNQDAEAATNTGTTTGIKPAIIDVDSDNHATDTPEGHKTDRELVTAAHETYEGLAYEESEDVSDNEPEAPALPPPMPNLATRPISNTASVYSALPVDPITPTRDTAPALAPAISPRRSIPPPPPRLLSEPIESEEVLSESGLSSSYPASYAPSEEEDEEPPRHLPMRRSLSNENPSDDERAPLPVLNRRSMQSDDFNPTSNVNRHSARPSRSIPLPPTVSTSVSDVDDSDFDEVLPTPPRYRPDTPATPPAESNEIPLIVPPPASDEAVKKAEPLPLRNTSHPEVADAATPSSASGEATPALLSAPIPQEILDEEEGGELIMPSLLDCLSHSSTADPIDPAFHSPSRRASMIASSAFPPAASERAHVPEEDEQAARRRTIAERMAKLGGIKFGAAPPLPHIMRPARPVPQEEEAEGARNHEDLVEQPAVSSELTEEEEERARKERIASKLAMMGGMRIGMMPLGVGAVRPQASHALAEERPPAPPPRAAPLARSPPLPHAHYEPESALSSSQYSNPASDEGVTVEAEDSEIEEVSYADAQETEEEPEEAPPPVPSRGPRKRGTAGSESEHPSMSPLRPPVPTSSLPTRRESVQSTASTARRSSADSSHGVPKASTYKPSSEYVMVEEPSGFMPEEEIPPPPPARPSHRPPPPRSVPPPPQPSIPISDSISSQWEMPSIPSSSIEFSTPADISLSWPEDSHPTLPPHSPDPSLPPPKPPVPVDLTLSSDDLMTVWGRVGVQICEVATTLYDTSKKSLVGDGTYDGFIHAVISEVPNAAMPTSSTSYGYLVYAQTGNAVQKRASEILPGDIMVLQEAKLKGHKGLQSYHQNVGIGEQLVGVVSEFEPKKSKVRLFQANQHVGQQTVEAVSYRLEDLKSGTVKVFRVLEN